MLAAALILAVMVIPFTSAIAREVLKTVPVTQREAAYALGATRFEAIRAAMFFARTGIIGAVMLGFGRALGETMAVTMVIGNNPQVSLSLFAPQYTMAAVIANEFTEAADELYLNALIEIGLVLFIITLLVNARRALLIWAMSRTPVAGPPRRLTGGGHDMTRDSLAPLSFRRSSSVPAALAVLRGAGAAGDDPVLRRQPGRAGAEPRLLHAACRSRSASPAAACSTPFVGTLILIGLGALIAIPVGVVSGVYMSEYAGTRLATAVRFAADTLNGVPSIVIGIFAYGIAVLPFRQFSALAGGLALGVMMIPIIARTTEELLLLVPGSLREGALALGATRARAVFSRDRSGRAARHHHRRRARAGAHRRGNGAAALHRVQQPVLLDRHPPADRVDDRPDLHLCRFRRTRTGIVRRGPARWCSCPSFSSARCWPASSTARVAAAAGVGRSDDSSDHRPSASASARPMHRHRHRHRRPRRRSTCSR